MSLLCVLLCLIATAAQAQSVITLPAKPAAATDLQFRSLSIEVLPTPHIVVTLWDASLNRREVFSYPCEPPCAYDTDAKVLALVLALNSANLTTRPLMARLFDRLILDFPSRFPSGVVVK